MNNGFDNVESGNGLLTKGSPQIIAFFAALDRMLDGLESMAKECRPVLNGERYLTDKEVAEWLKVSRRTLQEWRYNGIIGYVQIGSKILFRQSDIQKLLEEHLRTALE